MAVRFGGAVVTAPPKRRTVRRPHLDAATVPVERALLARAASMDGRFAEDDTSDAERTVLAIMADEFRTLAEELHWWG